MDDEADKNSYAAAAPNNPNEQAQVSFSAADFLERLHEMIARDSRNFDSWSELIEEVEEMCPDNLDLISLAYDSFLSRFPLCHWYWTKYTDHIIRLCDAHRAAKLYEHAVDSIPFSTGLWVDYCCFGMCCYEDPSDVRMLFKRALLFVRKDYFCHALWNQYIKYELTQQHWGFLAKIYLQVLQFPTEYLHKYYENFKQFVAGLDDELMKRGNHRVDVGAEILPENAAKWSENEISQVIQDLQNASDEARLHKAVNSYKLIGEQFYSKAKELDEKVKCFEANIERQYFDAAPLDDTELKTWHQYLDFIEKQDDFEWALQLYERCLITCTNYPEFWMRYVEFMESKGGRELAISALKRATQVFLKDVPEIRLFSARYKERIGDVNAAIAAFLNCDVVSDSLPEHVVELANMQRRMGNLEGASDTFRKAIDIAEKMQKLHCFPCLFIHYSRLKYVITGSTEAARDVLIDGIERIPHCSKLLEELIRFTMTHEGAKQVNLIDAIIAHAISPGSDGLALEDREYLSSLFVEFVDLCGTVDDIRKAWIRHIQLFPQLVRDNLSNKKPELWKCPADELLVGRQRSPCALPDLLREDQHGNQLGKEQLNLIPSDYVSKDGLVSATQTPQKCNNFIECERIQPLTNQVADEPNVAAFKVNEVTRQSMLESASDTPATTELMDNLAEQHTENVPEPMEITPTSVHSSSKATSELSGLASIFNCQSCARVISESAEEHSCPMSMQDQNRELHPNPVSLDNLPVNSLEKASRDLMVMTSDGRDSTSDNIKSADCLITSTPQKNAAADSVEVQESSDEAKSAGFFSSENQQMSTTKTHPSSVFSPSASGECCEMAKGIVSEGKTSGVHLHSKDQQLSNIQPNPTVALDSMMPDSQPYPQHSVVWTQGDQAQVSCKENSPENLSTKHMWPVNNVPDKSFSYPSHIAADHSPTLSQTSSYQQHQQPYLQLQQLAPQQQQQNQQQPSSWQQQQYLQQQQQMHSVPYHQVLHLHQMHQQVQPHFHQSAQQVHLQQVQQQQQQYAQVPEQQWQLYYQSQKLAYDMDQQGYQQHAAQVQQTLFQQYQLYQQGYGQMLQHQQHQYQYNQRLLQQLHQSPQHQQEDDEQQQQKRNQDISQISQDLHGQQNAPEGSDSALLQHMSPRSVAQISTEKRAGRAASPYQQPSHGTSPPNNRDTPESATSSHHGLQSS